MGRSKVTQRSVLSLPGADVNSDSRVNYGIHCAHLDLTVPDPTLVANHYIPSADPTPGTTYDYQVISATMVSPQTGCYTLATVDRLKGLGWHPLFGTRVRSIFSFGQHEEDVSASCRRL